MLARLRSEVEIHGWERSYCLAYSGGLDSQVLFQLCLALREERAFSFRAIHVHHGLSPHADQWASHCRRSCEQAGVAYEELSVDARPPQGESLEAYARLQRYALIEKKLRPGEILLTAHHQDDQAETFLLQLLRGAGLRGLSAMPSFRAFGVGFILRPLLPVSRAELRAFAEAEGLVWVEDESNQDPHYPRNFIRHQVLPLLKSKWPSLTLTLARSAEHCAEAQLLLDEFADEELQLLQGSKPNTLAVQKLLSLSQAKQRVVLRRWFNTFGVVMPNSVRLAQFQKDLEEAGEDREPSLSWGTVTLRRYQDDLYLLPILTPHDSSLIYVWQLKTACLISGIGILKAEPVQGWGLKATIQTLEVRFRQGGEVYRLPDGRHHELRKFFQEKGIPPWERDRLPLLYCDGELIAIPGYFVVSGLAVEEKKEPGFHLRLDRVEKVD